MTKSSSTNLWRDIGNNFFLDDFIRIKSLEFFRKQEKFE